MHYYFWQSSTSAEMQCQVYDMSAHIHHNVSWMRLGMQHLTASEALNMTGALTLAG